MLERMWRKGDPLYCWWECKLITATMENSMEIPQEKKKKKLGINLPYDPAVPLLGIYTEKATVLTDTCIPMFVTALFTIARTWKQPRCPSIDGQ